MKKKERKNKISYDYDTGTNTVNTTAKKYLTPDLSINHSIFSISTSALTAFLMWCLGKSNECHKVQYKK
jgi:hypothetical protein